jgi:hypothetical protein
VEVDLFNQFLEFFLREIISQKVISIVSLSELLSSCVH